MVLCHCLFYLYKILIVNVLCVTPSVFLAIPYLVFLSFRRNLFWAFYRVFERKSYDFYNQWVKKRFLLNDKKSNNYLIFLRHIFIKTSCFGVDSILRF